MMYRKILFIIVIFMTLPIGCSTLLEKIAYQPDINQGNYFTSEDVSNIRTGMTQQQVKYIIGTPMMTDPFGTNTWFYIFYQKSRHKGVKQKMLTLEFNNNGILINIDSTILNDKKIFEKNFH